MRIAVTGATGFVGQTLVPMLQALGHEPVPLARAKADRDVPEGWRAYNPLDVTSVQAALEGADGVVNLAGENILGKRWDEAVQAQLRSSRIDTTRILVQAMAALRTPPRVLVSASAVGIYGARGPEQPCLEDDPGQDPSFLARLCRDWEHEAARAEQDGTRVVALRIGMVLGREGGLKKMELPFRLGLGGRVGSGRQIVSWIHVEDLCRLIVFALDSTPLSGAVNASAPAPVTNAELTRALASQLHRPAFLPVPAFAVKLMLGPVSVVLLTGQSVLPSAAQEAGFVFRYETIAAALAEIYPD